MSRSSLEKQLKGIPHQRNARAPAPPPPMAAMGGYPGYAYPIMGLAVDPMASTPYPGIIRGDDEAFEDPSHKPNVLPVYGNSTTFNINNLLYNNILENPYFHALYALRTYHEVLDEISRSVQHMEPWEVGTSRVPSSAFCLLTKCCVLRLTVKQMNGMLGHDNAFIRATGFLYLRYTCPPAELFRWYQPYLEDDQAFSPATDKQVLSMGRYLIKLLTDMSYYGTTLPRIPVPIERKIKVLLLLLADKQQRRAANQQQVMTKGMQVKAIYADEENEPAWYPAVLGDQDEDQRYWVTFTEYGNTELVDLGDIELPKTAAHRDDKDKDRDASLMQQVRDSERQASEAVGRNYAVRPASYKGSLSLKLDSYTARRKTPSEERANHRERDHRDRDRGHRGAGDRDQRRRSRSRSPQRRDRSRSRDRDRDGDRDRDRGGRDKDKEMSAEQRERMNRLKERYGDASAK